jgi:predicted enzyme related to lactoylglutathione lyase
LGTALSGRDPHRRLVRKEADHMSRGFVWFHNGSNHPSKTAAFYGALLGWQVADGPPGMSMLTGDGGPFAAVAAADGAASGWIPYAQVDDVDAATARATSLGAAVLQPRTRGPAGDFTIVRDPGGAAIALWQKA